MHQTLRMHIVAAASAAVLSTAASATTLVVDQSAADCDDATGSPYCTIAAALAAAQPGDTVRVEAGTYNESALSIVAEGVTLRGAGAVVIDALCAPNAIILIAADNVSVKNLTLRNAWVGISATNGNTGLHVRNNIIEGVDIGVEFEGIFDSLVELNHVDGTVQCLESDTGILSEEGEGNTFLDNYVIGFADGGFAIEDVGDVLKRNTAEANDEGFSVEGEGILLKDNLAIGNFDDGFDVEGEECTLQDNVSRENGDKGYDIYGEGVEATGNQSLDNEDDGFVVDGEGNLFEDNKAARNGGNGFDIKGFDNVFNRNKANRNGGSGYRILGDPEKGGGTGNVIKNCVSKKNAAHGYDVADAANELKKNEAVKNDLDGFNVTGEGNVIKKNDARKNAGLGYFDASGGTEAPPLNDYTGNKCSDNDLGSSNMEDICT